MVGKSNFVAMTYSNIPVFRPASDGPTPAVMLGKKSKQTLVLSIIMYISNTIKR